MKCKEIIEKLEDWAPKETGWQKDNTGLQVGSKAREVKNILLCLDLTQKVAEECIKKGCNLIITHHPFLFTPIKSLDTDRDTRSQITETLIKNNITLYSMHTNLDFAKEGVSFQLAKKLGLRDIKFLHNSGENHNKIVVFVPEEWAENISKAAFNAGAGIIGEYKKCSFREAGKGSFEGSVQSNPVIGRKENFEFIDEVRIEFLVEKWKCGRVVNEIINAHPYEEPAIDILPVLNDDVNRGEGAIGDFSEGIKTGDFFDLISSRLNLKNFRYSKGSSKVIKKVAVCGGAGRDLLSQAIRMRADAFITADIKYHDFQAAEEKILFIDAGHYETEVIVLDELKRRVFEITKNTDIKVYKYSGTTNPVNFYKNKGAR